MKTVLYHAVAAMCLAAIPAVASADVIFSDNFTDGSTSSFTPTDGSLTIGANGGNNVLNVGTTGAVAAAFTPVKLNDGDSLALSFDVNLASTPLSSVDRGFKFELYNTTTGNKHGYTSRLDVGPADTANSPNAYDIYGPLGADQSTLSASGTAPHAIAKTTDDANAVLNDTNVHHFVLTLTRSGANIVATSVYQNGTAAASTVTLTDTTGGALADYTFNDLVFGVASSSVPAYQLDNVAVTYTAAAAVPEPASLGILGLGAVALLSRRRKS